MDESELAAALARVRKEEEEEARPLEERISKARAAISRYEKQVQAIRTKYDQHYHGLISEFRGGGTGVPVQSLPDKTDQRLGKKSLDDPLLDFLRKREWNEDQTCTVSEIADEWNRLHPGTPVGRATVRSVLDRLAKRNPQSVYVLEEGGRGNKNPRTYYFDK